MTHALHFLPEADYIYTLVDGKIAERGTFEALMASEGAFCKFVQEFGSRQDNSAKEKSEMVHSNKKEQNVDIKGKAMMQEEERNTGAISWKVYRGYLSAGNGTILVPIVFLSLALLQGSSIMLSYWSVQFSFRVISVLILVSLGLYTGRKENGIIREASMYVAYYFI